MRSVTQEGCFWGMRKRKPTDMAEAMAASRGAVSQLLRAEKERRKRKNKPYQRAEYPGETVQIDVKFVPSYCVADGGKYYPFTAKDECTRWTYREMYDEHSSVSAKDFLEKLVRNAPFAIRMVQTDNGAEFTNVLLVTKSKHKTLFEEALIGTRIVYPRICIATPRHSHNGKVERQYRTDEMRFYKHMRMYSLEDGRRQLAVYQRQSTNHIMTCLGMKPPRRCLVCTGVSCKQTRPSGTLRRTANVHCTPLATVKVGSYLCSKSPPFP